MYVHPFSLTVIILQGCSEEDINISISPILGKCLSMFFIKYL